MNMEPEVNIQLPNVYQLPSKLEQKLKYFKEKGINTKIIKWTGTYIIKNLFYLYLLHKYTSKCLIYIPIKEWNAPHAGLNIWVNNSQVIAFEEMLFEKVSIQIANCVKRGEQIVIIPLTITMETGGHANVLIYRKNGNVIEHFEPHSSYMHIDLNISRIEQKLRNFMKILQKVFAAKKLPANVAFASANDICPHLDGLQAFEDGIKNSVLETGELETSGYCLAWSMFFTELCLKIVDLLAVRSY